MPEPGPAPGPGQAQPVARDAPETVPISIEYDKNVVETRVFVTAKEGGSVQAGRHQLVIPAGALPADTLITLRDVTSSSGHVACEAYPEGLHFLKPVLLTTHIGDVVDPTGYQIYWVSNPGLAAEDWVRMKSSLNSEGDGLCTWLQHFSTYAPGKAGWGPKAGGRSHSQFEHGTE